LADTARNWVMYCGMDSRNSSPSFERAANFDA
jgi:hypothetical protein